MRWVKYVLVLAIVTTFILTTKSGFSQETQRLPQVPGIDISRVEYVPVEKNRSPQLEQAIIRNFGNDILNSQNSLEYSYNKVDLNDDGYPEALVYVQTASFCGSAGCPTLIFQGFPQGYGEVIYDNLSPSSGLIVTPQKTNGWKDIIGADRCPAPYDYADLCYMMTKFDGRKYSSAELISRRIITGKAVLLSANFHTINSSQSQRNYSRCTNSDNYCYRLGDRGPAIGRIISLLTDKGYPVSNNDDVFNSQLEAAIKRFQRDNNLQADGIIGLRTIELLCLPDEINSPNLSQHRYNQLGVAHRVCQTSLNSYPETLN
ncbi:peptidoglycan-binding domain-containing protein [Oscillatoria salina]|uniref:peptidoglycan-binding domain-containing protein n=1 Tax=Oscillatoria salina TaxID=331517 RepID=UPI001CCB8758|nr:peptidoglycan-binding domain-containing protein [Oscillatoria salina]MBZ8182046.1 peptidoglycan-binding protein [Oscillatoria salina IIICB1]